MELRASGVALVDCLCGGVARGLPLAIAGVSGSGRSVLALQLTRSALDNGAVVAYLCNEPAPLLLQQAATLDLALAREVASGRLALLELDANAALTARAHGLAALVESARREVPGLTTFVIDPLTALTPELLEESSLRREARAFAAAASGLSCVLTLEAERLEQPIGQSRVLSEICGSWIQLEREAGGARRARRLKSRGGALGQEELRFSIGAGGALPLADPVAEPRPAAAASAAERSPGPAAQARRRVLIADPDPAARERFSRWLAPHHQVLTAADGLEALTAMLANLPDLVVLDLRLPKVSGLELLTAVQKTGGGVRTLVLAPQLERAGDRLGPLVLGASDVIARPTDALELLHEVRLLLQLEAPPPLWMDPADAVALFGRATPSRELDEPAFRERLARACAFGREHAIASSLVCVETATPRALDGLLLAADRWLRFEDATLRLAPLRALLLLVAARPEEVSPVLHRLCETSGPESRAQAPRFAIREARVPAPGESWERQFPSEPADGAAP